MNQFVYIISFYVDKSLKAFLRCFIRSQINDSLPATCYCLVQPNKSPNFANSLPQIIYCYVSPINLYIASQKVNNTIFAYMYVVYRKKAATSAFLGTQCYLTLLPWH